MFGNIFDFDMNGKTDAIELALGLSIMFDDENKKNEFDEEYDFDFDFLEDEDCEEEDDLSSEINISNLECERETLAYKLAQLQDRLFDLEDEEPDDYTCAAYDHWERRKNRLTEQIFDLEDKIVTIRNMISFGRMGMRAQAV